MQQQRQTAYKLWVSDILRGVYSREEGEFGLNYILIKDKKISRVNLIGTFVDIYRNDIGSYIVVLLDDGSGTIRCRNWNEDINFYNNISIGSIVLVVGKLREQGGEIFVIPEFVKPVKPIWAKIRGLELKKKYGFPEKIDFNVDIKDSDVIEEVVVSGGDRQKILGIIEKSKPEGIDYSELILKSGLNEEFARKILNDLLKEGEIFEPKLGILKILG